MKGAPHAQDSRTHSSPARHNDYVMRGFLYRLDFRHDLRLLAVAGFGHGAHRLNGFVSGALRLSGFHARGMRIIPIWNLHYISIIFSHNFHATSLIIQAHLTGDYYV